MLGLGIDGLRECRMLVISCGRSMYLVGQGVVFISRESEAYIFYHV
jgi:hypothetical protein